MMSLGELTGSANQEAFSRQASENESVVIVREDLHHGLFSKLESTNAKLNA